MFVPTLASECVMASGNGGLLGLPCRRKAEGGRWGTCRLG